MVKTLSIIWLLILFFYPKAYGKTGIGYYFKDQRVMKKFYAKSSTHFHNKVASRVYKAKKLIFQPNDFNVIPSSTTGIKKWTQFFIDIKVLKSRYINPIHQRVFQLSSSFSSPYNMFVDLRPKKVIILPEWTKSLDFMILGSENTLQIELYFEYPNGLKMRFQLPLNKESGWQKIYLNLFQGDKRNYYRDMPIKLTKIRVKKTVPELPSNFTLFLTDFKVYNYQKTFTNQYIQPYDTLVDFEKGHPRHWFYTIDNQKITSDIAKITNHDNGYLVWQDNKKYLSLSIPPEIHKNKNILIYLPVRFYKLKKEHQISFWIKGNGKGEEVSAIFQEGKWRYFELVIAEINFIGWKKLTLTIPEDKIVFFKDSSSQQSFINLIGLKISCAIPDIPINLGFDQIEGVVIPRYLGDPKEL